MRAIVLAAVLVAFFAVPGGAVAQEEATAPARGEAPQEEKSFTWDLSWAGWRGLQYELRQRVSIGGPDQVIPHRLIDERVGLKGRFGGKLLIDGAAFFTTSSLPEIDDGVEVRQARIYTIGEIYLLIPVTYKLEVSVIGNEVVLEENYLAIKNIPVVQTLTAGNTQTPFSLESIMSLRDLTFMEQAAPTQAFAPGVKPGVQVGGPVLDERATWGLGFFSGSSNVQLGNLSGLATGIGRVTRLAVDREGDGPRELVHLGLGTGTPT